MSVSSDLALFVNRVIELETEIQTRIDAANLLNKKIDEQELELAGLRAEIDKLNLKIAELEAELAKRPPLPPPPPPPPLIEVAPDIEMTLLGLGSFRPGLKGERQGKEERYSGYLENGVWAILDLHDNGQIRAIVERCKADLPVLSPVVETHFMLKVGSGIVHDNPLRLHPHTRPSVPINPTPMPTFNLAELIKAGKVPNYDPSARPTEAEIVAMSLGRNPYAHWNGDGLPFDPISERFDMMRDGWPGGAGDRLNEAAPLNPAEVGFLTSADSRMWQAMCRLADTSGNYPIHYLMGDHWPLASESGSLPFLQTTASVMIKTAAGVECPVVDVAHMHSLAYVAALLTGDRYYREEVDAWRAYTLLTRPRSPERLRGIIHSGQERATAWGLRGLLQATQIENDFESGPNAKALRENLNWLRDTFVLGTQYRPTGVTTVLKFRPATLLEYVVGTPNYIATWNLHVLCFVLDECDRAGFIEARPIRDHLLKVAEGVWKNSPTIYDYAWGNHAYPSDDWAEVMKATFAKRTLTPNYFDSHTTPDYAAWARAPFLAGARKGLAWAQDALAKVDSILPGYKGGVPDVWRINP